MSEQASSGRPMSFDPEAGILYDLEPHGKRLIMSFSGLPAGIPMPPFEFLRMLSGVDVKKVFVRDHAQAWFHRGVRGIGAGVDPVAEHIRGLRSEADDIVMIGTSAGGYAALLFGALVGCEAHAFVPQTFIDADLRRRHDDKRWPERIAALGNDVDRRYADLRPVLQDSTTPGHIYYGGGHNGLDRIHAEHLGALPQVTLHEFDSPQHNVVVGLRESGWLSRFLQGLERGET